MRGTKKEAILLEELMKEDVCIKTCRNDASGESRAEAHHKHSAAEIDFAEGLLHKLLDNEVRIVSKAGAKKYTERSNAEGGDPHAVGPSRCCGPACPVLGNRDVVRVNSAGVGKVTLVVDIRTLRFTQNTCNWRFRAKGDGKTKRITIGETADRLRVGASKKRDLPMMEVVRSGEQLWSLDNRRLVAFLLSGARRVKIMIVPATRTYQQKLWKHSTTGIANGEYITVLSTPAGSLVVDRNDSPDKLKELLDTCNAAQRCSDIMTSRTWTKAIAHEERLLDRLFQQLDTSFSVPTARDQAVLTLEQTRVMYEVGGLKEYPPEAVFYSYAFPRGKLTRGAFGRMVRALQEDVDASVADIYNSCCSVLPPPSLATGETPLEESIHLVECGAKNAVLSPGSELAVQAHPKPLGEKTQNMLALLAGSLRAEAPIDDPVSALYGVFQKVFKPQAQEALPLVFEPFVPTERGMVVTVTVCGIAFMGEPCLNKKRARQSAAEHAIRALSAIA